jgi:ribonuclease HI
MYTLHFDGLYRSSWYQEQNHFPPRDIMCYGWLVHKNGEIIARGHGGLLHKDLASSNSAEYIALIEGLEALLDLGVKHEQVCIFGDAKSVIDQMSGDAGVSSKHVKALHQRALRLSRRFTNLQWIWSPRRRNRDADQLTRKALRQIRLSSQFGIQPDQLPSRLQKRGFIQLLDLRMIHFQKA